MAGIIENIGRNIVQPVAGALRNIVFTSLAGDRPATELTTGQIADDQFTSSIISAGNLAQVAGALMEQRDAWREQR